MAYALFAVHLLSNIFLALTAFANPGILPRSVIFIDSYFIRIIETKYENRE